MTIIGDPTFRVMGPLAQAAESQKEQEEQTRKRRDDQNKAAAYQAVAHSYGVPVGKLTPAQRAMADATYRAQTHRGSVPRGYGFSLDTSGRVPNK